MLFLSKKKRFIFHFTLNGPLSLHTYLNLKVSSLFCNITCFNEGNLMISDTESILEQYVRQYFSAINAACGHFCKYLSASCRRQVALSAICR